jgi:hypothetical protein
MSPFLVPFSLCVAVAVPLLCADPANPPILPRGHDAPMALNLTKPSAKPPQIPVAIDRGIGYTQSNLHSGDRFSSTRLYPPCDQTFRECEHRWRTADKVLYVMHHLALPMKTAFFALLVLATSLATSANNDFSPQLALHREGVLAITDGSSFYIFSRDGTFHSYPNGMSGRLLDGTFTSDGEDVTTFTVIAKQTWLNGVSADDDYRKIVFRVYPGSNKPGETASNGGGAAPPKAIWSGYYLVDELSKIPKPPK